MGSLLTQDKLYACEYLTFNMYCTVHTTVQKYANSECLVKIYGFSYSICILNIFFQVKNVSHQHIKT